MVKLQIVLIFVFINHCFAIMSFWQKLKNPFQARANCVENTKVSSKVIQVPLYAGYVFDCVVCKPDTNLSLIWIFLPEGEMQIRRFYSLNTNDVHIYSDGRLWFKRINSSGVLFCQQKGVILNKYLISTIQTYYEPVPRLNNWSFPVPSLPKQKFGNATSIYASIKFSSTKTNCGRSPKPSKTLIAIKRQSMNCFLQIEGSRLPPIADKVELKFLLISPERSLPCADRNVAEMIASNLKNSSMVNVRYQLCVTNNPERSSLKEKMENAKSTLSIHVSHTVNAEFFEPLILSCPGLETEQIQWQIIMKEQQNKTQVLSPLYVKKNSNGRIYIDYMNNLCFKKFLPIDSIYYYKCLNQKGIICTIRIQIKVAPLFEFNFFPSLSATIVVIISTIMMLSTVYKNWNIDSKI